MGELGRDSLTSINMQSYELQQYTIYYINIPQAPPCNTCDRSELSPYQLLIFAGGTTQAYSDIHTHSQRRRHQLRAQHNNQCSHGSPRQITACERESRNIHLIDMQE